MSLTSYGIEQMINGPDPSQTCLGWDQLEIVGGPSGPHAPEITRSSGKITWSYSFVNGEASKTITGIRILDGTDTCKEDTVAPGVVIEPHQGVTIVVEMELKNA